MEKMMMIELSALPQTMQAYLLNETAETVQVVNNGQIIKELAVNKPYEEIYFDIERMKQMIGETDENGCAKHTVTIPKGLAKDKNAFYAWLKANAS